MSVDGVEFMQRVIADVEDLVSLAHSLRNSSSSKKVEDASIRMSADKYVEMEVGSVKKALALSRNWIFSER